LAGIQAIEATMAGTSGNLGRATLDLDIDERTFSSSLKRAEGNAQGFVSRLTGVLGRIGLASIGIQAVTGAIVKLGQAMMGPITAASDLAESQNKANVIFGKSVGIINAFAETSAQAIGQSKRQVIEYAGTFGNLFKTMGLSEKAAAGMSKDLIKLAADQASFNNLDTAEVLEKIRAGLIGEAEPMRSLGIIMNEAAVTTEATALGLGTLVKVGKKTTRVFTEAEKVQARYSLILKQSKTSANDFANTSDGMANALRIIDSSFEDISGTIGEQFLPTIAPLIASLSKLLPGALKSVTPLLKSLGQAFQGIVELIMGQGWTNLYLSIQNLFGSDTAFKIREVVVALGNFATTVKEAIASGDFSKVWESVKGLGAGLLQTIKDQVSKIDFGGIWESVKGLGAGLLAKLPGIAASVLAWLKLQWPTQAQWGEVWKSATTIGAGLVASTLAIGTSVVAWLVKQWPTQEQWTSIWNSATTIGAGLAASTIAIGAAVLAWLKLQWPTQTQWTEIWDSATTMGAGLVASVLNIAASVTTWLTTQWGLIDWKTVWAGVKMSAADIGASDVTTTIEGLNTALLNIGTFLTTPAGQALGAFLVTAALELVIYTGAAAAGTVATGAFTAAIAALVALTAPISGTALAIGLTIAAVAGIFYSAYMNSEDFRRSVDAVAAVVIPAAIKSFNDIVITVRDLFNLTIASSIKSLQDMWTELSEIASFLAGAFNTAVGGAHKVVDGLEYGFSLVSKTVSTVIDTIKTLIDKLGDIKMPAILQTIANKAAEVAGLVGGIRIPGYASGTSFAPGGMAIVGEYGPELVNLPRGSQVIPNGETMRALQGAAGVVNNYNLNANYRNTETEMSLRQTIRMLQMADGRR
jgi:hypothetical protein